MEKVKAIKNQNIAPVKKVREQKPYLTKRILISAARRGFKKAAEEAMAIMGYVVIAKDGWVVKKYADGTIEKMTPLENEDYPLILD